MVRARPSSSTTSRSRRRIRIEAIGPDGLHDRFLAHPSYLARVARRIDAYGLQFASEARDELTLPAFIGNTRLRWGAPLPEVD